MKSVVIIAVGMIVIPLLVLAGIKNSDYGVNYVNLKSYIETIKETIYSYKPS